MRRHKADTRTASAMAQAGGDGHAGGSTAGNTDGRAGVVGVWRVPWRRARTRPNGEPSRGAVLRLASPPPIAAVRSHSRSQSTTADRCAWAFPAPHWTATVKAPRGGSPPRDPVSGGDPCIARCARGTHRPPPGRIGTAAATTGRRGSGRARADAQPVC